MGDCIVECKYVDVQICRQNCNSNFVTKLDDCPFQVLYYHFLSYIKEQACNRHSITSFPLCHCFSLLSLKGKFFLFMISKWLLLYWSLQSLSSSINFDVSLDQNLPMPANAIQDHSLKISDNEVNNPQGFPLRIVSWVKLREHHHYHHSNTRAPL